MIRELKKLIRSEEILPTDLLNYRIIFKKYGDFNYSDTHTLQHISHFLGLTPVTGLNTINNILSMVRLNIPVHSRVVSWMTRRMMLRSLNLYFRKLRRDDALISFETIEKFDEAVVDKLCFERGIMIEDVTREQKIRDLKLWLSISNLNNVPDSLLLFSRIVDFEEDVFDITDDEDEYEVLRHVDEVYLTEKMQVFERTFGIDDLEQIIAHIETKREAFIKDKSEKLLNLCVFK